MYLKNNKEWSVFCDMKINDLSQITIINPYPIILKYNNVINKEKCDIFIKNDTNTDNIYITSIIYMDINIQNQIKNNNISCNIIGGLGNQIFSIFTAYAFAKDTNSCLIFNKENTGKSNRNINEYWDTIFKNIKNDIIHNTKYKQIIKEKANFIYQKLNKTHNNCFLSGYYQNILYFDRYKKELKQLLSTSDLPYIFDRYKWFLSDKKLVAIHVRRGDYVSKKLYHHNVPIEYYNKCIKNIKLQYDNLYFVCFSDDILWCKSNINSDIYIDNEQDHIEFQMLQLFNIYILANSTFSWWGAYLNDKTDHVYVPYKWLETGEYPYDLVLKNWTIIKY